MKNVKKLTAVSLAVAILAAFTGCGDQSWSYKTEKVSLSAGTYIYNLLNGYYEAYDLVESPDEAKDILKEEVENSDKDTGKKTVEQYALDEADDVTSKMVAVEDLFKQYGLELNQEDYEAAKSYTSQLWGNMKKTFEDYGISEDSFNYCYAEYSVKYSQVFDYLYGENGEKYVADNELTEYYKNKYTGYAYFSMSMTETDADGNSVVKTEEEIKKAEEAFDSYAKMINSEKKSYKDTVLKYAEDYQLSTDPTSSGSYNKDENNLDAKVAEALDALKEGEASVVKTGTGESEIIYLVYKPVTDTIIDFLETDEDAGSGNEAVETDDEATDEIFIYDLKSGYSHSSLLNEMKGDDYEDYLADHAKSLNIEKNSAIVDRFKPKMFVD